MAWHAYAGLKNIFQKRRDFDRVQNLISYLIRELLIFNHIYLNIFGIVILKFGLGRPSMDIIIQTNGVAHCVSGVTEATT